MSTVKLHGPTIEHVRGLLALERGKLPVLSPDITTRGAAVIVHDVMGALDAVLTGLLAPVCTACEAAAAKRAEDAQ
jgi:hypothetical protein